MPDRTGAQNSLSITRHATQALLHQAFDALPSATYGLLSGQNRVVQAVSPFNLHHPAPVTIKKRVQSLESDGMEPLALYISSASHDELVDVLRNRVIQIISETGIAISTRLHELPLLVVRLDTKGRMEAVLFGNHPTGVELPLLLQEDGQTIPHAV